MSLYCPFCYNLLFVGEGTNTINFFCEKCPITFNPKSLISHRVYYSAKSIDDVLSSDDAWKYCDVTSQKCPKCSYLRAYFLQLQTRSADEPMTNFYRCCNSDCAYNWRD